MRKWKESSILLVIMALIVTLTTGAAFVERGDKYFLNNVTVKGTTLIHDFLTLAKMPKTTYGNGAGVTSASTAVEYGDGVIHETVLTVSSTLAIADSPGVGACGALKLYDFPAGAIQILGSTVNLTASSASGTTHGIVAAADGDFALGTVACGAGSLTSTEADIIASTALAQFATTAGVIKGQPTAAAFLDGTTTAKDLYLNVIFDDADSSAADTLAVAGTITVVWTNLGDY